MLNGRSVLAIIPARSGSKGLKDKNIRLLAGKPMLAYSIIAARSCGFIDSIILSTDSKTYAELGEEYGAEVPFLRDAQLATDTAGSWDVVREVLARLADLGRHYEVVVLLQPTSPLRSVSDINGALELFSAKAATAVVSVCEADHPPNWTGIVGPDLSLATFLSPAKSEVRRQDFHRYHRLNGAIYVVSASHVMASDELYTSGSFAYIMPRERSIDVDTLFDFICAEAVMLSKEQTP